MTLNHHPPEADRDTPDKGSLARQQLITSIEGARFDRREKQLRLVLDFAKMVLAGVGAIVAFLLVTRPDFRQRYATSKEEIQRGRAELLMKCVGQPDRYDCVQTICFGYLDPGAANPDPWCSTLSENLFAQAHKAIAVPQGSANAKAESEPDYCQHPPHDWWSDWHIDKNMIQLNPIAVPHNWVEQLSEKMDNRPLFATGSVLVLHPLSVTEPASVSYVKDLRGVAGKTITLVAAGSPYGDGELRIVANGDIIQSAVVNGTRWFNIVASLPSQLSSLRLESAAGGTNIWFFETTFTKRICFS